MSLANHPTDLADRNLGITSGFNSLPFGADEKAILKPREPEPKLTVTISQSADLIELSEEFIGVLRRRADAAEEEVLDRELDAANAERIAQAARLKAVRLRAQYEEAQLQFERLLPSTFPDKESA